MADKKTNTISMIMIVVIVVIFSSLIGNYLTEIRDSEYASLSNTSEDYIAEMIGESTYNNNSYYRGDQSASDVLTDTAGDNELDFALDFTFGLKSINTVKGFASLVLNVPEYILKDLFKIVNIQWFVDILDWIWRILLITSFVYFVRGINQ